MEPNRDNNYLKRTTAYLSGQSRPTNRIMDVGLGKIPPQALDLEEAVLGALMIEKDALTTVVDILKPQSFYKEAHQRIYNAILILFKESQPVDMLTVVSQLRKTGELEISGGAFYIPELTSRVNSAANIEYHARIVSEMAMKRELISAASEILRDAYEDTTDVFKLLDRTEQSLFTISESNIRKNYERMGSLIQQAIESLEKRALQKDGLTGVPTGFSSLDRVTSGWQKSDLVILAARPGMGKTAFVVSAMRNAAVDFQKGVAMFSLEMSSVQLVNRLISAEAELESEKIKKGSLLRHEWEQLHHKIAKLTEAPIFIDDTPGLSILELRAKCRRLKSQHDIQLIIIDYLQLMTGDTSGKMGGNREQEIASISRALKNLAKELDVPVIALSQLSRAVETRGGDKRPQLSDLRESGCLTGDTLIMDAESGQLIPIKVLAERKEQYPLPVLAANEEYRVSPYCMSKVFYSGRKLVYEIKTRTGRSIKASANHPFLKVEGWRRLDELRTGDQIATVREVCVENPVNPLSEDALILLAHLVGDGCVLPRQPIHYTSADMENIFTVQEAARRLFGIEGRIVPQKNWYHLYLPTPYRLTHGIKHPISLWYERLGLERVRSYEKRLPDSLFASDRAHLSLFLRHLWATDGNISWKKSPGRKDGAAIYYASSSPVLATQVQHLLLRLGIQSHRRQVLSAKGYRPMYHVHVSGVDNQRTFLQLVGCAGERGRIIPAILQALQDIQSNVNCDVIPKEAWGTVISSAKQKAGISWRTFAQEIDMAYCGSSLFNSGISRERMGRITNVLHDERLHQLAHSDIYWDEIISITELGEEDVYDATVEEVHNFAANDFIVHNSIEQDADMVIFLYRPEYYGITQDEAGNSIAGIGEVIIAKHRNGSLDTVPLRFIGKFTKFGDLDPTELRSLGSNPFPDAGGIPPEFNAPGTITLGSKVNSPNSFKPNTPPEEPPF